MRIYKHEGQGHYIGSCIVVVADSMRQARKMIKEKLDEMGLTKEGLEIKSIGIKAGTIVVAQSGDY